MDIALAAVRNGLMKEFLEQLRTLFRFWRSKLKRRPEQREQAHNGATVELGADECLSRFLYSRSKYSLKAQKAKPSAFNPLPYHELSTAHITGMTDDAIWELSKLTLRDHPGRDKLYARADIDVAEILKHRLTALRNDNPFPRHTAVRGWPLLTDPAEQKELWLQIALELSQTAALRVAATPISKPD